METVLLLVGLVVGLALGVAAGWFAGIGRSASSAADAERERADLLADRGELLAQQAQLVTQLAEAEGRRTADVAKLEHQVVKLNADLRASAQQQQTEEQLLNRLTAQTGKVMAATSEQLLVTAEQRYARLEEGAEAKWSKQGKAVTDQLVQMGHKVERIEAQRRDESTTLANSVKELNLSNAEVRREAASLSAAMRDTRARGHWGEVQLKRVLELSGLESFMDFAEQSGSWGPEASGRPDVVVNLPNDRRLVIDAKVPCERFLEAANTDDQNSRAVLMAEHGKSVLDHAKVLAKRDYTGQVGGAVDFVVMFLPGEPIYSAALEARPALFEEAAAANVIIATPSTLLALLRTVAIGWREHRLAEDAAEIARLGNELYGRMGIWAEHYAKVGKHLNSAVKSFNEATGSLESRLLPTARTMGQLVSATELPTVPAIDLVARQVQAPELVPEPKGQPPEVPALLELVGDVDLTDEAAESSGGHDSGDVNDDDRRAV